MSLARAIGFHIVRLPYGIDDSIEIIGGVEFYLDLAVTSVTDDATSAAGVIIGTPLLCGPGTITTVMLLSKEYGLLIPFAAITLSLLATWIILYYAETIQRVLGNVVTDIMGKVLGMLVAAIAVKIIASGILAYIATI